MQLLLTETTKDPLLLTTLVCLERQQQDNIPEEYIMYRKKLSTRYGLVFYKHRIIVPKMKPKFDSAYFDKPQIAISGTKHKITTSENGILHRKHISKSIFEFTQEPNNSRPGLRGPDGRFTKSPKLRKYLDSDSAAGPYIHTTNGHHDGN